MSKRNVIAGTLTGTELTFEGASRDELHCLYRFPAKLHPPAARMLVERYSAPGDRVGDIFCGSGTVAVEAGRAGRSSLGHDIDPLAILITRVKVGPCGPRSHRGLEALSKAVAGAAPPDADRTESSLSHASPCEISAIRAEGIWLPEHPNLGHWYSPEALRDLGCLREVIVNFALTADARSVADLVYAKTVRRSSNADPVPASGLEVTTHYRRQVERRSRVNNPFRYFAEQLDRFVRVLRDRPPTAYGVSHTTSRRDAGRPYRGACGRCNVVITSPPYGIAVDYGRRHSLEHYWLGYVSDAGKKVRLGRGYIGRRSRVAGRQTGRLTSDRGLVEAAVADELAFEPQAANAFTLYCTSMRAAMRNADRLLAPSGRLVLIVGRSRWVGVEVPAERLLAELAGDGFVTEDGFSYRSRNRFMSYARRNGADIDREHVVTLRKLT